MKRMTFFINLFNVCLKKSQLDSLSSFCIQSVAMYCFGWSMWRKSSLTQIHSRKRKSINNLYRYRRHSSLILHPTWTRGSYLKVHLNVLFILLHENAPVYLVLWVEILPMRDFETLCFGHLGNVVSLSYAGL